MSIAQSGVLDVAKAKPVSASPAGGRIQAIDFARGVAITLMILNHGVKGLLPFDAYPEWGLVPLHMMTRFASSLFIIVFGIGLAVAFLPKVEAPDWPRRRLKLVLTGVVIFFWYKVLTVFEMLTYEREQILAALTYRAFPSFVEILGFYALALLWVPFFLPLWRRMSLWARLALPTSLVMLSYYLQHYFDFWGSEILKALLVEHENHYTWGQISRAPLIMLGLLIGELIGRWYPTAARRRLAVVLAACSILLFVLYLVLSWPDLYRQLLAIAYNEGKHPPELLFMLFSLGGAFGILAVAVWGGERLAALMRPVTLIGSDALKAFVFHIFVIFVLMRYLLGYWHNISYGNALIFTVCLIFATALWIKLTSWLQSRT